MNPQPFGKEHLIYLAIFVVVATASLILAKKFLKTKNQQTIFIKTIAGLTVVSVVLLRIGMAFVFGLQYIVPNSFCAMTSLVFGLVVLFGHSDMKSYHALWYLGLTGGFVTLVYPDFISQNPSFFYHLTFTSFLHHSFVLMLAISLVIFRWFKPQLGKIYILPLGITLYIIVGYFELFVLKADTAMCINQPILSGTPINCWFILGVGTVLAIIFNLILNAFKTIKKNNQ